MINWRELKGGGNDKVKLMYLTKFGNNLSFNPHLSLVYFFHCFFTPFMTKQGMLVLCFPYFEDIFSV